MLASRLIRWSGRKLIGAGWRRWWKCAACLRLVGWCGGKWPLRVCGRGLDCRVLAAAVAAADDVEGIGVDRGIAVGHCRWRHRLRDSAIGRRG